MNVKKPVGSAGKLYRAILLSQEGYLLRRQWRKTKGEDKSRNGIYMNRDKNTVEMVH